MARKSSLLKLPSEVRTYIAKIREDGSATLDEIVEAIQDEFGVDVSRSALHRYTQQVDAVTKKIRDSRFIAESVAKHFGDKKASDVARVNIEILHTIIMDILMVDPDADAVDGNPQVNAGDAMKIAIALEKLTKAHKTDTDRELKIREEAAKQAMKQASEIVETTGKEKGLSPEQVKELKTKFLGIKAA